ncbi:MAG: D-sedoheptulose 7-phosphate isomerase [Proteobacteria bacterium]|nr:D-sedoheptulose 7-phosphate isomerase [Desulfobulbaceae bacterium]MBU4152139.1 D-sedoheptulose 7-phosphate isomerase [Pseudomonadota bacterium]MDP2105189.1 D-sedoheptulose 7-phosphate isomerase [Desulfobulbaceae bacterium]
MQEQIAAGLLGSIKAKQDFADSCSHEICRLIEVLVAAFGNGNKLLIFGNGGSAADAQHMAAEFVNRFLIDRRPLPAIALTTDSSILTSIGNDFSFADIFIKQIQALGKAGDVALGISTSGNSPNVIKAIEQARLMGLTTAVLTGGSGGELLAMADIGLNVPTFFTPHIQESHIWAEHLICQLVDETMFGNAVR